ncbi:hypothetical protein H9657_16140 [Cellulomonas sp. Sa3CUA2]|uniref:Activator of HSP90 ATPase n=1 Tax=Cellulomonas avistercoris TaxID=2762242 RepID=A0ABR8QH91_9CELL|nr:hypothetical protein [Cellulomonas avistercoris]MBD7919802.1 hypothetical protein [Cellulomonas avistercoris]
MSLERREVVSVDVRTPISTVWDHLRDPHLVRRWFGWDHDGLDAEIREIFVDDVHDEHDHSDGRSTRSLVWRNHDRLTVTARDDEPTTTRVVVTRPSHEGLSRFDGIFDEMDEGWIQFVHQLAFALDVHPGEDRVTLTSHGMDAGERRDPLLFRAGLHGVRGLPVHGHVDATRPDGSRVGGTVVYKTEHQVGIHLHGIAQSLLVLVMRPAVERPPHGTVDATLSTYGLDAAVLDEARRRWAGWWGTTARV